MLPNNISNQEAISAALIEGEESGESQLFDVDKFKKEQAQKWLKENKKALEAHNQRIDANGVLITPEWLRNKI